MNELTQALTKKLSPKTTLKDIKELVQANYNVLSNIKEERLTLVQVGKLEVLELMQEMLEGAV
jgi:ethanolamine ammonia-lyase small subunit